MKTTSIKDILYEPPGPRIRRLTATATAFSLVLLAALAALIVRQFYVTGQLSPRYWNFFARATTWRFLGQGLAGTMKAALSLGMRDGQVFSLVVFPQALRYVVPALIAELVIVLKDTTFAYVVNYADLMQNAKVLISNYDALLPVYLVVSVIYILINFLLNQASVALARRGKERGL